MLTIKHLLAQKGSEVYSTTPETLVYHALEVMRDRNIGALVVVDRGSLIGIFSERDYARKVILHGRSSHDLKVADVMSTTLSTIAPDQSIEECMEIMTLRRIRHLPVVEEGRIVGMVSIGDVVKLIIDEQRSMITDLECYIRGKR